MLLVMHAKPKTTYKLVSADSWRLIRAAYLSGLSGPTVAARFDISVAALRKRAAREGWTKRDFIASAPAKMGEVRDMPANLHPAQGEVGDMRDQQSIQAQIVENVYAAANVAMPRATPDAAALGRRALLLASRALAQDRPRDALAHAKAAHEIARLDGLILDIDPAEDDENVDWRMREMRKFIWQTACVMADHMAGGGEAPTGFKDEIAAWKAERALEAAADAARAAAEAKPGPP